MSWPEEIRRAYREGATIAYDAQLGAWVALERSEDLAAPSRLIATPLPAPAGDDEHCPRCGSRVLSDDEGAYCVCGWRQRREISPEREAELRREVERMPGVLRRRAPSHGKMRL